MFPCRSSLCICIICNNIIYKGILISAFSNSLLFLLSSSRQISHARDSDKRKYIKSVLTLLLFYKITIYIRSPKHVECRYYNTKTDGIYFVKRIEESLKMSTLDYICLIWLYSIINSWCEDQQVNLHSNVEKMLKQLL